MDKIANVDKLAKLSQSKENVVKKDDIVTCEKNNKKSYKNNKKLKMIEDSVIRKFCMYIYKKFDLKDVQESTLYRHIHDTFIFLVSFIALFSMNLTHMTVLFIIVSFDALAIVVRHGCPLTALERKYIKRSSCDDRDELLGALGISYNCNHEYEKQVELLINVWLLVAAKCMCIIVMRMFNIKLFNYNNIYSND
jgi:hypothetical protein